MRQIAAGLLTVALVACAGGGLSAEETRLAESLCTDLRNDLSISQMYSQALDHYQETRPEVSTDANRLAAAELMDAAIRQHCPDFTAEWERTAPYDTWIAS